MHLKTISEEELDCKRVTEKPLLRYVQIFRLWRNHSIRIMRLMNSLSWSELISSLHVVKFRYSEHIVGDIVCCNLKLANSSLLENDYYKMFCSKSLFRGNRCHMVICYGLSTLNIFPEKFSLFLRPLPLRPVLNGCKVLIRLHYIHRLVCHKSRLVIKKMLLRF